MKKLYFILVLLLAYTSLIQSQEYALIDFGSENYPTEGNWNNITTTTNGETDITANLIDDSGGTMGITLTIDDPFDINNTAGTTTPDSSLPFLATATRDSFFGETSSFNGTTEPSGGFILTGLDPTKYYSFSIFASRNGVSDNRETLYTISGNTTESATLDPANNTSNTAEILNLNPTGDGELTLRAEPGVNNTNSTGFYYLGAIKLTVSDEPITIEEPDPELALIYPNGGHLWEVGKTVRIKWESVSVDDVLIEFSSNNGSTWSDLATVPGDQQYYDATVLNEISTNCLIRISGETLTDTSDNPFSIIANDGVVYRIVILGSSTAYGTGPDNPSNAWAARYSTYLIERDTRYEVINLALGGFTTYDILPTGSNIPSGVNEEIDIERNITKALSLDPGGIIINMPSNDAAKGYPVEDQVSNYNLLKNSAENQEVPLWVTTPQPRDFGSNSQNLEIQKQMVQETYDLFGDNTIDFWTGFGNSDNSDILPEYDSGDGIHMNDAAHEILFVRIVDLEIAETIKDNISGELDVESLIKKGIVIYPNPISDQAYIILNQDTEQQAHISLTSMLGQKVLDQNKKINNNKIKFSSEGINSGIYLMQVNYQNKIYVHKIVIQ